jgi:hypothetical protein
MTQIPVHIYPGGDIINIPDSDVEFKWIDTLGGQTLPGPLEMGAIRPDGKLAHHGIATVSTCGKMTIEYYHN